MNLIERFQDEVYSLALSLTNNPPRAKALAIKVFVEHLGKTYGSYDKIKLRLFKYLLKRVDAIAVKKDKNKTLLVSFKRGLPLFDRKVFVLKYELGLRTVEIASALSTTRDKVRKSLLFSAQKLAKKLGPDPERKLNSNNNNNDDKGAQDSKAKDEKN
ncbi:MAG: hypothetical protein LBC07_00400 [Elusimicrobiota bacterium]|jgi:DNA-directed RNA polymerase specialized sigma24 family protein|nr:hypothetical protein [Elusimicrobiota bacterium]